MEKQKIVNLFNGTENENSKFATRKWYIIDSETKGNYSPDNDIKFLTNSLESSLCDYSDAYIIVTGNITVTRTIGAAVTGNNPQRKQILNAATQVLFKNYTPLNECRTEINENFIDKVEHTNITMPVYNLIKYSGNYSDTSAGL